VQIALETSWDWEVDAGDDRHTGCYCGSRARLELRQGAAEGYRSELYVVPIADIAVPLAALKVLSAIMKDVAAPASPVSNTGMARLDGRYDHAAADGARRSLRPEEATAVGQIMTMGIEPPRVKFAAP
jgi:hypothetical protein